LGEHCDPEATHADTVLVLDASSSMLDPVRPPYTKRDGAIAAAARFVELLKPGDQAAIVWFHNTSAVEQTLTEDKAALQDALQRIANDEFTRIDLGINRARAELWSSRRRTANQPVIVLLTDGKANPEPVETAIEEARLAKHEGATVFAIGLGSEDALDHAALQEIASRPSYYFRTADASALMAIYEAIAGVIPCPPERFWGGR
jgi:Mg-chelatase subunit ChlD